MSKHMTIIWMWTWLIWEKFFCKTVQVWRKIWWEKDSCVSLRDCHLFSPLLQTQKWRQEILIYACLKYDKIQPVFLPVACWRTPLYLFILFLGLKEAQWSPLADSERKDSLSVNVEFVKFHLSRSRKLNFQCEQQPSKGLKSSDQSQAVIRFSSELVVCSCWWGTKVMRKVLQVRFSKMKIYYLCEYCKKHDALVIEITMNYIKFCKCNYFSLHF
jgi:hypothetical protein